MVPFAYMTKLKPKKTKPRVRLLRALPYKGHMLYVRMIDRDMFEWLIVFNGEIYTNYMVIKPSPGREKLTEGQISQAAGLLLAGGEATIDTLLGQTVQGEAKERAQALAGIGEDAD